MNISRRNMNRILARALSGSLLLTAVLPVTALAQTDDGNQTEDERQIAEETAASLSPQAQNRRTRPAASAAAAIFFRIFIENLLARPSLSLCRPGRLACSFIILYFRGLLKIFFVNKGPVREICPALLAAWPWGQVSIVCHHNATKFRSAPLYNKSTEFKKMRYSE